MNISTLENMNILQQRWIAERRGEFDYSDLLVDAYDSFDQVSDDEITKCPEPAYSHRKSGGKGLPLSLAIKPH